MIGTLRRLVRDVALPMETALAMVTAIPARAAGLDAEYGRLGENSRANILLLEREPLQGRCLIIDGVVADRDPM